MFENLSCNLHPLKEDLKSIFGCYFVYSICNME